MRVTLIQTDLHWENPAANRDAFTKKLLPLAGQTDLVVLPEMFTTGFSMHPQDKAEVFPGITLDWMLSLSFEIDAAIVGSVMSLERRYSNRLIFAKPNGSYEYSDKRHLFRMAGEDKNYSAGEERVIIEWKGWRILPLVCYDLRFPVWSRNVNMIKPQNKYATSKLEIAYDLLLYIANWPERRRQAWNTLLPARGIENLSYVAAVNRIGTDGTGLSYSGDSAVYDYLGNRISTVQPFTDCMETIELNKRSLDEFREQFPAWKDADGFEYFGR